ncbi:MAG: hypothetical protein C9356_19210 [Oleiphilus sp.]|nr:MAG: hypothetical protein C9356_19210 [Oleiphilus sp.]
MIGFPMRIDLSPFIVQRLAIGLRFSRSLPACDRLACVGRVMPFQWLLYAVLQHDEECIALPGQNLSWTLIQ